MTDEPRRRMRAEVSHDLCVGSTMCLQLAPGAFALDENRQAVFAPGDWELGALQEAADGCPMQAITIVEDNESA
jgi:ferredoxin